MSSFDNDENFRNLIGGSFGQVEASVGPEAYHTHNDVQKSIAEFNRAQVEMIKAQTDMAQEQKRMGVMLTQAQIETQSSRAAALRVLALMFLLAGVVAIVGVLVPFCLHMWSNI